MKEELAKPEVVGWLRNFWPAPVGINQREWLRVTIGVALGVLLSVIAGLVSRNIFRSIGGEPAEAAVPLVQQHHDLGIARHDEVVQPIAIQIAHLHDARKARWEAEVARATR